MVVLKFGGKSLATKNKVKDICEFIKIRSKKEKIIVVVSAFGNTTDNLIGLCKDYSGETLNKREYDAIVSTGEIQAAALVAMMLGQLGVSAISLSGMQANINTLGDHLSSVITSINKSVISDYLNVYQVVVVAGFQGINDRGDITTIGRGGSDTTAVALGAVFSSEVEIYSDYDGVFAGDPQNLQYIKYDCIDYKSMLEYSLQGAKVLSSVGADIANQAKVPTKLKQSDNPLKKGTFLSNVPLPFVGLTLKDNLCLITIVSSSNDNIIKTANYVVNNITYYYLSQETNKLSVLIDSNQKKDVESKIAKFNNLLLKN